MFALILSAVFLILMLSAFIFGVYYSAKKRKNGGCSGCSGCPSAGNCDKKQNN